MTLFICKFCSNKKINQNSLRNHERLCKYNPERQSTPFQDLQVQKTKQKSNQFTKAKYLGIPTPEHPRKGKPGKPPAPKSKEALEKLSKLAIERGLGGVRQSKRIEYKGKKLGSTYELVLAKDLDKNNICWDLPKKLTYIDPTGKTRSYTADLFLLDYNVYLDPKNDFLLQNNNPRLGFSDLEKIKLVEEQNNVQIIILNKTQLSWIEVCKKLALKA